MPMQPVNIIKKKSADLWQVLSSRNDSDDAVDDTVFVYSWRKLNSKLNDPEGPQ